MLTSMLFRYRYKDIELVKLAVEDFLKGPGWLLSIEPDICNKRIREKAYSFCKIEELEKQMSQAEKASFEKQYQDYMENIQNNIIFREKTIKQGKYLWKLLTLNGWILPHDKQPIGAISSMDTPLAGYRKRKLLLFEPFTKKGIILEKSYRKLLHYMPYYVQLSRKLQKEYDKTALEYQTGFSNLINIKTWKEYLGLKDE